MAGILSMNGVEFGIHRVCRSLHCSLLTLNMLSARYLQLSGLISNHRSCCVVAFSVSDACSTLIPHHLLRYSAVVFECSSSDKKASVFLVSVELFCGYSTVSMWMYFTSWFVTSLAICCCCSLVALSITIACFPDIRMLATSLWLILCVLNIMSSSSIIWQSSS